jgi:hypothetical protein
MPSDLATVLRSLRVRGGQVMWLLGAGASASANMPTAYDLTLRFQRDIYCSREHVAAGLLGDLADPSVRARLEAYARTLPEAPTPGAADEYSRLFEMAYPSESDRRAYLDPLMRGARPSYGHRALGALMTLDQVRTIWTPNFDTCVEDAYSALAGSTAGITVATPETADVCEQAINERRSPLLVKLHGDFRYRELRNTVEELRNQDSSLRAQLVQECRRGGLAVVGYSGRDDSIMDALMDVLAQPTQYPGGLFWFHRPDHPPMKRVTELISAAAAAGVEAHLVEVLTFDELLADLLVLHDVPAELAAKLDEPRAARRRLPTVTLSRDGGFPIVRMNALRIDAPAHFRLVVCEIGNQSDVLKAVTEAGDQVLAARRNIGVLAFGRDDHVRATFASHAITDFGIYPLDVARLRHESAELGLCYVALHRALIRDLPLVPSRPERTNTLCIDASRSSEEVLAPLREAVGGAIVGEIPGTNLHWAEAVELRFEYQADHLWLCLGPHTTADRSDSTEANRARGDFLRARQARRYNPAMHELLGAWQTILAREAYSDYSAFGCSDGVDATFRVYQKAAFSGMARR